MEVNKIDRGMLVNEKTYFLNSHLKEIEDGEEREMYYPIHAANYKYPTMIYNACLELSAWLRGDNITESDLKRTHA